DRNVLTFRKIFRRHLSACCHGGVRGISNLVSRGAGLGEAHWENEPRAYRFCAWARRSRYALSVLLAVVPNTRAATSAVVQLHLSCRSWPARAHSARRQTCCRRSARRTCGVHLSWRMDQQLSYRRESLYRVGVLFRLRALSCRDAARAATSAQDNTAVVVPRIPGARARAGVNADLQAD